jgi:hypothetical protein
MVVQWRVGDAAKPFGRNWLVRIGRTRIRLVNILDRPLLGRLVALHLNLGTPAGQACESVDPWDLVALFMPWSGDPKGAGAFLVY